MNVDTIRALFTYLTAFIVAIGGMVLIFLSRTDPAAADFRVVAGSFVGGALTFLFGSEVATRTARQATASTLAAHMTNGNGGAS